MDPLPHLTAGASLSILSLKECQQALKVTMTDI
jgi:hypothetical protein